MNRCPICGSPHGFSVSKIRTGRRFLGFYWAAISGDLMECSGCHTLYRSTSEGVLAYRSKQSENVGTQTQQPTAKKPDTPARTDVTKWQVRERQSPV